MKEWLLLNFWWEQRKEQKLSVLAAACGWCSYQKLFFMVGYEIVEILHNCFNASFLGLEEVSYGL